MFTKNFTKNLYVYDIETDGLIDNVTKIHCLSISWRDEKGVINTKSTTKYEEMKKFFTNSNITRVGHNITLYDERVISMILGVDTLLSKNQIIDTLALSWYLYPEKLKHGLEEWGKDLGIYKIEIKDWKNLKIEDYINRCERDTRINLMLWEKIYIDISQIYECNTKEILRFIDYLQFKLDCVREQETEKLKLDIPHINAVLSKLKSEKELKEAILLSAMPKVPIKKSKSYKNVIITDTGDFYEKGSLMFEHYFNEGYRPKLEHKIETVIGWKPPNPNSTEQKKSWLYELGWIPETFEYKKEADGSQRKIPQISNKNKDGTVCESIKKLFLKEPKLELLEGLSLLSHRIAILEGFLSNEVEGYIRASMKGLTNTLRLKHVGVVNLPGVFKPLGKEIRACLIAEDNKKLCGSDMSSLEDSTKQHYMYFYDPAYVKEMRTPGFDPHLDIALLANMLTKKQVEAHKNGTENHKAVRTKAKIVNFSSVYGASPAKIALTLGGSLKEAQKLHKTYWERNKAVKEVSENCKIKQIGNKKWLFNPVSKFWYSLRADKDRFSTLNQGKHLALNKFA